jgi:hypothetical protein
MALFLDGCNLPAISSLRLRLQRLSIGILKACDTTFAVLGNTLSESSKRLSCESFTNLENDRL